MHWQCWLFSGVYHARAEHKKHFHTFHHCHIAGGFIAAKFDSFAKQRNVATKGHGSFGEGGQCKIWSSSQVRQKRMRSELEKFNTNEMVGSFISLLLPYFWRWLSSQEGNLTSLHGVLGFGWHLVREEEREGKCPEIKEMVKSWVLWGNLAKNSSSFFCKILWAFWRKMNFKSNTGEGIHRGLHRSSAHRGHSNPKP